MPEHTTVCDRIITDLEEEVARLQGDRDQARALAASLSEDWHRMQQECRRLREALEDIRREVGTSTRAWHLANQALTGEHCAALGSQPS